MMKLVSGAYRPPKAEGIFFGQAFDRVIDQVLAEHSGQRSFVLVSKSIRTQTNDLRRLEEKLGSRLVGVFDGVTAHTPREAVFAAAQAAKSAQAEVLITLGGGSQTDAGKIVQLCLSNDIDSIKAMDRLIAVSGKPAAGLRAPKARMIALPTTLSAGEFTAYAGMTNSETGIKESVQHPYAVPSHVILDPALTLATPMPLWLSSGVRAIDHAVEGYLSIHAQPFSQAADLQAMRLLPRALLRSYRDPSDLQARFDCQIGMWLSMVGSQSGVSKGASHAIGHLLGSWAKIPHGITSCITLANVLRFNSVINGAAQVEVAKALGADDGDAAGYIEKLVLDLDLPSRLGHYGIRADQLPELARLCMHDRWIPTNPRNIPTAESLLPLLERML
jgi:maleylacetate reductase